VADEGESKATRRLAVILAADVAGYSRLMGADEAGTLARLDACRALFRAHIEGRGGRVVDMAGDSVFAVFDSVVEAVACTAEVQGALAEQNAPLSEDGRMCWRIGVNLGDVLVKADGTVYGDGVNVAARLQSLAEPGGIVISGAALEQVEAKLDLGFAFLGEQRVKNIARPVRAFRVVADDDKAETADPDPQGRLTQRIREVGEAQVCTSIIVAAELRYAAAKKRSPRLAAQLEAVLDPVEL
jgi:class 3 adenylate cyclase